MTFGQKVRKLREERGMTTTELAELAHIAQPTVSQYESGARKNPYPNTKIAIAMALDVKPSDLDDDRDETREVNSNETNHHPDDQTDC